MSTITWSEAARGAFERHLALLEPTLAAVDGDRAAAVENLRRRMETETGAAGRTVVEAEQVERFFAALRPAPRLPKSTVSRVGGMVSRVLFFAAGVALPAVALVVELFTRMAADFFDPLPTLWHVAAIAAVPIVNALALWQLRRPRPVSAATVWLLRANAATVGVSLYYALWFLPLTPFAVLAIMACGVGLLPLAPLLALITGLRCSRGLRRGFTGSERRAPRRWPWLTAAVLALLALEMPAMLESWARGRIAHGEPAEQVRAVRLLRNWGNEETLLQACYYGWGDHSIRRGALEMLFGPTSPEQAQLAYFRITGRAYNQQRRPARLRTWWSARRAREDQEWILDNGQGGEVVGPRLAALTLKESKMKGRLNAEAAAGYLEWTLVFRNDHAFQQREARALVQLPAGAVVSRLTLWIDGEEREAAFGRRGQVREAYQKVVNQRRDPVLVTSQGGGRVLVQCFPVPVNGGEMKLRLGVTLPLVLENAAEGSAGLPRLVEQNFSTAADFRHVIDLEADGGLLAPAGSLRTERAANGDYRLRGLLTPAQLEAGEGVMRVGRDAAVTEAWARDPGESTQAVMQTLRRQPPAGGSLVVVLDGSGSMRLAAEALAAALERETMAAAPEIWMADDTTVRCPTQAPREAATWLRHQAFEGGHDVAPVLRSALRETARRGGTVLWIHGGQPQAWLDSGSFESRDWNSRIRVLAAADGLNVVRDRIAAAGGLVTVPQVGSLSEDIGAELRRWRDGEWTAVRRLAPIEQVPSFVSSSSSQLWRLWAADEVERLRAAPRSGPDEAVALAVRAQLVSSVTSAVVLEQQAQYDAAGLKSVDRNSVPTVPDSAGTLVLVGIGLAVLAGLRRFGPVRSRATAAKG